MITSSDAAFMASISLDSEALAVAASELRDHALDAKARPPGLARGLGDRPQRRRGCREDLPEHGRQRLDILKDTQTAIEAGFTDFEALAWWGVFAPKDTPPATVENLSQAIKAALSDPAAATLLKETQQMTLVFGGPAELKTFFAKQVEEWGKVVRENRIKA